MPLANANPGTLTLQPRAAVQTLCIAADSTLCLRAHPGPVWITCEGLPDDFFLTSGEALVFAGPARIYLSTEGRDTTTVHYTRA